MTRDEILGHPKVQEIESRVTEARANLLFACQQCDAAPFDLPTQVDILTAAQEYKRAWNVRNLAIADMVTRYGVVEVSGG